MGKFDTYTIPIKSMPLGVTDFDYRLDNAYFQAIGEEEIQKGDIAVRVHAVKTSAQTELDFTLTGHVIIPCDRCLEEMEQPIKTTGHLIVRLGETYSDDGDDTVIVPEEQGIINVAWFMYEFVVIAIPVGHVHPFGLCDKQMSQTLSRHIVDSDSLELDQAAEEDSDDSRDTVGADDAPDRIDPRWSALRGLRGAAGKR